MRRFRDWDFRAAQRVDRFVAISEYIATRIERCYGRSARVIYPPVNVRSDSVATSERSPFYVTLSRLVPYKRVDLIVAAFADMPERELVVAGDGPDLRALASSAPGQRAALSAASGMPSATACCPVRVRSCLPPRRISASRRSKRRHAERPVIAFFRGGAAETLRGLDAAEPTAVFFTEQTSAAIRDAVILFERSADRVKADFCRANAKRFETAVFRRRFGEFVGNAWDEFRAAPNHVIRSMLKESRNLLKSNASALDQLLRLADPAVVVLAGWGAQWWYLGSPGASPTYWVAMLAVSL